MIAPWYNRFMTSIQNTSEPLQSDSSLRNILWPIRVYYEDTDAGGIVYYANYLKFFERARTEWLRRHQLGQHDLAVNHRIFFVVKKAYTDYYQPARLDDELTVSVVVEKLGKVAVEFYQQIHRGEQLLVECRTKVGCVSADTLRPVAIPESVHAKLAGLHGVQ